MKVLLKYFLNGVLVLSPLLLTIFIVSKVLVAWDTTAGKVIPIQIPGLPLLISILVIIAIGFVASWWLSLKLLGFFEYLLNKVPVVQFIYGIIKDTLVNLLGEKRAFSKVAVFTIPGTNAKMLGFVTSDDLSYIGFKDHIAIYLLHSMQWSGFTLLVPKNEVEILEGVKIDEIMKFVVSAGAVSSTKKDISNEVRFTKL